MCGADGGNFTLFTLGFELNSWTVLMNMAPAARPVGMYMGAESCIN